MERLEGAPGNPNGSPAAGGRPSRPSLVEQQYRWLEGLPGGGHWVFPVLGVLAALYLHAIAWLTGELAYGAVEREILVLAFDGPYAMWAIGVARGLLSRSLHQFRPALDLSDDEFQRRHDELVPFPRRRLAPLLALGVLIVVLAGLGNPSAAAAAGLGRPAAAPVVLLLQVLAYASFPVAGFYALRVLRGISRLHTALHEPDLQRPQALFGMARVTAWIALAWVFNQYLVLAIRGIERVSAIDLAVAVVAVLIGGACFVLPLLGLHNRLAAQKARLLEKVDRRTEAVVGEMDAAIDARRFEVVADLGRAMTALAAYRTRLEHLSTWPWPSRWLPQVASALVLPLILLTLSELVGRTVLG